MNSSAAAERKGNKAKHFKGFYLKAKTRTWPWLSFMCNVRSEAVSVVEVVG